MAIRSKWAQGFAAATALAIASPATAAPALDLFYQRALMSAADQSCRLFAPDVAQALAAAKAQARGAALRSGANAAELAGLEAQAGAQAIAAGCRSPVIAAAAARVREAFTGYASLPRMDFPGETAGWTAERRAVGPDGWLVSQHDRFGWDEMVFGLAAHGAERPLTAVASFADGAQPYGARLVLRDAALTDGPYLDVRQADISGRLPIDARLPPRAAARVFAADALTPARGGLAPKGVSNAWAVRFPAAAEDALAALDPREAVAVEFLFAGDKGEEVRTAYVEVGDFAAAKAFQALPPAP